MNSSQLLIRQMNTINNCTAYNTLVGPTGPRGPGLTIPGALKAFTIFIDWSSGTAISRVYIPPYLFGAGADSRLPPGGVFTTDIGTDLVFLGNQTIVMNNTTYAFASSLSANGYVSAGNWEIVPPSVIASGSGNLNYTMTADYGVTIGTKLADINNTNYTVRPTTGIASGFLATITIFYV